MERTLAVEAVAERAAESRPEREAAVEPAGLRNQAMRRVLKRRSYAAQQALLRHGAGAAVGAGEEADLARAGFEAGARDLPHRGALEQAFGRPLGDVKAHVGPEAADASTAMGAEAYALGSEVAFREASPSKETVAHEVAHVVQQSAEPGPAGGGAAAASDLERGADQAARSVVAGAPVPSTALQAGRPAVRRKPLPKDFSKMWDAHPHNYQADPADDTKSEDLMKDLGFPVDWNTCAVRLSTMLNALGEKITPAKCKAAGLKRPPSWVAKKRAFYILAAAEMWTYLSKNFRKADVVFPKSGRFADAAAFRKAFADTIKPVVASRQGIVAFEKLLTGYEGTGHVDLFDGEKLSDAPQWYPCEQLHLWYVEVP